MTENRKLENFENFGYMGVKGLLWWCVFFGPFLFFVFGSIPFLFLSFPLLGLDIKNRGNRSGVKVFLK